MDDNNVMVTADGKELPLPPTDPVEAGIVVPAEPAD